MSPQLSRTEAELIRYAEVILSGGVQSHRTISRQGFWRLLAAEGPSEPWLPATADPNLIEWSASGRMPAKPIDPQIAALAMAMGIRYFGGVDATWQPEAV